MNVVNVVVTCTKDKKQPVPEECKLRNVPGNSLRARFKEWQSRINRNKRNRVIVKDLYAGDHWSNVRSFGSAFFEIDIWVCSAGLGLVRFDDLITPYAATFSQNHPDSISAPLSDDERPDAFKQWWQLTSRWKAQFEDRPRSLAALMAAYPNRSLLVAASKNYLRAIADDIRKGLPKLSDPDQLSIVCSGVNSLDGLDANLVPCDARFQAATGGARRSLNTRLANKILREARVPPRASILAARYRKLLRQQPAIQKYDREPMTDDEVRQFILRQLNQNSSLRHTPLLRMLRNKNKACEQKRFSALYREVVESING
ncbi:hypothetical protein [Blastopirellula marina]|uniref:Uncharacterized protein n=1 Tax=Blastopirellula marina DSM 3645 TaxID=314230 RepID=A3ZSA8_9BACT|nr:hypothetical protein [Blastopirellula marina]EAQ80568.1 hypothetical protein DSM3645_14520 [Blastopirellula marina DSM 3645]